MTRLQYACGYAWGACWGVAIGNGMACVMYLMEGNQRDALLAGVFAAVLNVIALACRILVDFPGRETQ